MTYFRQSNFIYLQKQAYYIRQMYDRMNICFQDGDGYLSYKTHHHIKTIQTKFNINEQINL